MATKHDVFAALMERCGFEVVKETEERTRLRVLGRIPKDRGNFFLLIVHRILAVLDKGKRDWTCDISKMYLLRGSTVVYSWRLIFQSDALEAQYADIAATIRSAPRPARVELESILLPGYEPGQTRGGLGPTGKGASSAESIPLAMRRSR